ncbi:MAG: alpha/beta fold hydrolase [Burkholderiaceae bacterium]
MTTIKVYDGAEIACEVTGDGESILLVPGLGGNASFWTEQIPLLAGSYRVITYDHRGAGRSTMSRIRYSVEQMAEDALAVLDGLGIERAHLVGHSTGGAIGQVIALEKPKRLLSLVASSSWASPDPYFTRLFQVRLQALERGVADYVRCGTLFQYSQDYIDENIHAIEAAEEATIARFPPVEIVASKIEAVMSFNRSRDLHRIQVPTLVNTALDDLICPPRFSRELAHLIPKSVLSLMTQGAHFCPRSVPRQYFRNIQEFLKVNKIA